jgi:DNA ligase-1
MLHVLDKGGEGLMLRQPRSAYERRRSKTLYKYKHWYDAEGLVVGQEWGQGEHKGRMGAVRIEMECKKTLTIGSGFSLAQRDSWQPTIGKVIRYRFQELTQDGTPRFPIYEGTAPDKTKARDAIVKSVVFRANAKAEDLERALTSFQQGGGSGTSTDRTDGSQRAPL